MVMNKKNKKITHKVKGTAKLSLPAGHTLRCDLKKKDFKILLMDFLWLEKKKKKRKFKILLMDFLNWTKQLTE